MPGSVLGTGHITISKEDMDSTLLPSHTRCSYGVDRRKTCLVHGMHVMKEDTWDALGVCDKGRNPAP